jgi:hypothetical protein
MSKIVKKKSLENFNSQEVLHNQKPQTTDFGIPETDIQNASWNYDTPSSSYKLRIPKKIAIS